MIFFFFFFQAEDGIRDPLVTGVQTCALPISKGYQISQYDEPLCLNGRLRLPGPDGGAEIGITRAHLEEDAAKTLHLGGAEGRIHGATASLVDFNRGGTPLVEIVTEPDI